MAFAACARPSSSPTCSKISPICPRAHTRPTHLCQKPFVWRLSQCGPGFPLGCNRAGARRLSRGGGRSTKGRADCARQGLGTWMRALARDSTRPGSLLNMISQTRRQRSSSNNLPIFHTTLSPDRIILASISRCCASVRAPRCPSPTSCAIFAVLTASINTDAPVDLHPAPFKSATYTT